MAAAAVVAALGACADAAARAARAPPLGALAAQMRAVRQLPWDAAPLGAFPELRARLGQKQRGAAEALLEQLGGRREELRAVRDSAGTAAAAVLRLYEERAAELGLGEFLAWPALPLAGGVLEGLQDVGRYYQNLYRAEGLRAALAVPFARCCPHRARKYLGSKLLLQRLSCDNLADMEALPQS